jgi:hypothetical protein
MGTCKILKKENISYSDATREPCTHRREEFRDDIWVLPFQLICIKMLLPSYVCMLYKSIEMVKPRYHL